jgi:uncharacterized metal-binding protein
MPNARTHDAITLLLAVPAFAASYGITRNILASSIVTAAFVFGGLMFGPDLDTISRQYSRWSVFRVIWLPYRSFFKHRSRFSHGLLFGALIRVFYFCGALTLVTFAVAYGYAAYSGGRAAGLSDIQAVWRPVDASLQRHFGDHVYLLGFLGIWLGAASHTFTDLAGSFIKTGRVAKFL